jgi:SAM-dependent methyltransferase
LVLLAAVAAGAQSSRAFTPHADVRDILVSLADLLPDELRVSEPAQAAAWTGWIAKHDEGIRTRIARGDADTLVNWLLFGTSFTSQKRVFLDDQVDRGRVDRASPSTADLEQAARLIAGRIQDLVTALSSPGNDERRLFARQDLEQRGFRFEPGAERARLMDYLRVEVSRLLGEQQKYARELERARGLSDSSADFAARSRIYRERGLSVDTLIQPSFALEQALKQMATQKVVVAASLRRVAVIGPGLDISDKSTGYDFYPPQTLQPFALLDSLQRLGLAHPKGIELTAFDINPRVVQHLVSARDRARSGNPYLMRLPLDRGLPWRPELVAYWEHAGDRIGVGVPDTKVPSIGQQLDVRTVSIRPGSVLRILPSDLNVVTSQPTERAFDLIVATNVFVYYDTLDQALALANIERMLQPGGILLSNNALLELPTSRMRSWGYLTVPYSDRSDDGDHIVWYRRVQDR